MAIKKYKPTSPARRQMTVSTFEEITKKTPERSLLEPLKSTAGRNSYGRITVRHRGGGAKRKYRIIDENGDYYLLSTANEKDMFFMFHINPSFSIEIEFLKTSRLVLHMKIIDEPQTNKKVRAKKYNTASDFRKIFNHYFYIFIYK